jgi:basic membrane lipoprotein Med (substrate-binding protein (PBP1-ABC) superfamily)
MEAHVAAGNRADALRVYERCRRLLAEELGAYPSPETESIYRNLLEVQSGDRVAEEPEATSAPGTAPPPARRRKRRALGTAALIVLVVLVAAGTAIAVVVARGDKSKASAGVPVRPRVALIVPRSPPWSDDPSTAQYRDAIDRAHTEAGIQTQTFEIDLSKPGLLGLSRRARQSIGNFGLVLLAGQFVGNRFEREFARLPHTRFVVLDPDPINGSLYNAVSSNANTSDVFFIEGPGAYLAGFLSARMAERQRSGKRPVVISEILVDADVSANVVTTFTTGARKAVHDIEVLERYAGKSSPPSACEAIAANQIERGSRVVFADAGPCSAGALSAAQTAGVMGVAADQDPSNAPVGTQILGYTVKNFGKEVDYAIGHYVDRTLPRFHHVDIGIESGAVDFVPSPLLPKPILASLARERARLMPHWETLPAQK